MSIKTPARTHVYHHRSVSVVLYLYLGRGIFILEEPWFPGRMNRGAQLFPSLETFFHHKPLDLTVDSTANRRASTSEQRVTAGMLRAASRRVTSALRVCGGTCLPAAAEQPLHADVINARRRFVFTASTAATNDDRRVPQLHPQHHLRRARRVLSTTPSSSSSSSSASSSSPAAGVPRATRALVYDEHGTPGRVLTLRDLPLPEMGPHDVLVRWLAAPINPADLNMIEGEDRGRERRGRWTGERVCMCLTLVTLV